MGTSGLNPHSLLLTLAVSFAILSCWWLVFLISYAVFPFYSEACKHNLGCLGINNKRFEAFCALARFHYLEICWQSYINICLNFYNQMYPYGWLIIIAEYDYKNVTLFTGVIYYMNLHFYSILWVPKEECVRFPPLRIKSHYLWRLSRDEISVSSSYSIESIE